MGSKLKSRILLVACLSIAIAVLIGATTGIGVYVGNRMAQNNMVSQFPPMPLNAGTATRTKSLSMATGSIDGNVEGLFLLDHLTGNLQCWVLGPRNGAVGGYYTANAAQDLAGGSKTGAPEYMMVTGDFFFTGGNAGNLAPGQTVCYVGDATTGNVVGYGLIYDKQAIRKGIPQKGNLKLVCKGTARTEASTRDQ